MRFVKVASESVTSILKKSERNCIACPKAIKNTPYDSKKNKNTSFSFAKAGYLLMSLCGKLRSKISIKSLSRSGKKIADKLRCVLHSKYVAPFVVTVCFYGLAVVFNGNFSFAYNAFFNGTELGFVPDKIIVENAVAEINSEFADFVSGEDIISGRAAYAPAIIRKNSFTEITDIKETIKSTSDVMVKAYSIRVSGKAQTALESGDEAESVINSLLTSYKTDENTLVNFAEEVSVVHQFVPATILMSTPEAIEHLGAFTTVISSDTVSYLQDVPFTEETTDDNTMYEGNEKILKKGINGTNKITEETIRVNGEIQSTTVLSNICLEMPRAQLRAVGTKERPYYMGTGSFLRPYGGQISSRFGARRSGNHTGVDLCGKVGDPIVAADTGTVIFSGWSGGYGKVVKIDHHNGYVTYYAHCDSLRVEVGDVVKKGQRIATVGNTGNSTGPHLHFEIRLNDEALNPMNYID